MTSPNEYPTMDGTAPVMLIESSLYQGELITDCKEVHLSNNPAGTLKKFLDEGWKLVAIAWVRDENTNYGQAPAVSHVLRAVVVKTEKKS